MFARDIPIPARFTPAIIEKARKDILEILAKHPTLVANGAYRFDYGWFSGGKWRNMHDRTEEEVAELITDRAVAEFLICIELLNTMRPFTKIPNAKGSSSYGWKHVFERLTPWKHIYNGTFILAVLHLGIPCKLENKYFSPNPYVGLRKDAVPTPIIEEVK